MCPVEFIRMQAFDISGVLNLIDRVAQETQAPMRLAQQALRVRFAPAHAVR